MQLLHIILILEKRFGGVKLVRVWNLACMAEDNPNCPEENGPDLDFSASSISIALDKRDILIAGQKSGGMV